MYTIQVKILNEYDATIYLYTGNEIRAGIRKVHELYGPSSNEDQIDDTVAGFVNGLVMYIKNPDDVATVLHETYHMTNVALQALEKEVREQYDEREIGACVFEDICVHIIEKLYSIEVKHAV
jgi:hypothetical protein